MLTAPTKDGNTKNGEPTLSNGNGWHQFWDEDTQQWVITDNFYDKQVSLLAPEKVVQVSLRAKKRHWF